MSKDLQELLQSLNEQLAIYNQSHSKHCIYQTHLPIAHMFYPSDPSIPTSRLPETLVSAIISAISINQVAQQMPQGEVKNELIKSIEKSMAGHIAAATSSSEPNPDVFPGGPVWHGPGPNPYAQINGSKILSEIAVVAQAFDGQMREDLLQCAVKIAQKIFEMGLGAAEHNISLN